MLTSALAIGASLVAFAFGCMTFERWRLRRLPQDLAWSIALGLFVGGALALAWGASVGWSPLAFRVFYAFGAVLNVPFLAAGQLYLLVRRRTADIVQKLISLLAAFALGVVLFAPMKAAVPSDRLPQGSEVFDAAPRVLAAVGSGLSAVIIFGGTAFGLLRVLRAKRAARRNGESIPGAGRRLAGLGLLATGTVMLSLSGTLNSRLGAMRAFSVTLTVGVTLLFSGFALSSLRTSPDSSWVLTDND
jgi:hypothetical protein